ncbi:N-acetylmuramoyl-L-alanine amidase [Streptomyces sp. A3M-1-3]|uniref:peptidoglycan recognition protein family protein n=1 Tax=Streptomyces sp. A3M-1-3 TaxID=2962044 RepID=UPI0020B7D48D|nr:N-acetylmuramoyl-L-alanine amidase [Streptomyces sp. A3M-1-3]MCP3820479.1 N-acetylmuramoyl-L-alanine amidase [Streptomyces sp. A3M-1-3]
MRGFLASSIGVACTAALALPLAALPPDTVAATPAAPAEAAVPGSTQSLPLAPLGDSGDRTAGVPGPARAGLPARDVRTFSLVGVVWDDADAELHGSVQVRTRATGTTDWSGWQDLETHNQDHSADPETDEHTSGRVRGSTAPLWVGDSDGVEVRVQANADRSTAAVRLPSGMRIELVDPGDDPQNTPLAPLGAREIQALSKGESEADAVIATDGAAGPAVAPYIGPRPRIVTRKGWGADEKLRETGFVYTKTVKAAFVHHSASGNNYQCSQASSVLRSIYRYHVRSNGWRDFGYNFAVDKCGNIYEGRAGGVAKPVLGAHTLGFNSNSMGIAVLGSFGNSAPPKAAVDAVARLTAWKLGLYGANPLGRTTLTSGGGNLYKKGRKVRLNVISGHRDGFATECPGARLYSKLGSARTTSAQYQGR